MNTSLTSLSPKQPIPVYKGMPILGSMLAFARDPIIMIEQGWREYGDIFKANLGPRVINVLSHPSLANEVLIEHKNVFQRSKLFEGGTPLTYVVGLSLLTTDGESWLQKRRMMQPIFHKQNINTMFDKMVSAGVAMIERWEQVAPDKPINFVTEMKTATLDIINRTMFTNNVLPEIDRMGKVVDESLAFISSRIRNPFALPARWQIVPSHKHFWQQRELLDSYLYKLIRERRADLDASTQTRKHDLLEMLLLARDEASGEGMNDEQIRNEVATIYGAGHETTALALTWAFYALSQNPQVWQKLCDEVARVLNGRTPTLADLPNLPYSLAVFEETLRLYPPVPLTVRFAYDDCQVSNYLIRKGEMCAIGIRNIHRHPDFWHNPVQFEPERFLPQNKAKLNRTAYLPFLTGPHICIGNNFALMEGQLLLAMIAQRYNVQVLPNQHIVPELAVTMRPKHGVMVNLRKKSTSI